MRLIALFAALSFAAAQPPDPAYASLTRAYAALKARDYDPAIAAFLDAIAASPARSDIRKDLAYTYLKVGENILARDQFRQAMQLDPPDTQAAVQVAMEYAFLCYETKEQAQARRIFDRIRHTAGPSAATAEQAFQNIDAPLAEGIERWTQAIAKGANNFSAHFELASLAEQRDQLPLAAEHYEKAWRILPDRRSVLVDLGRVWLALHHTDEANAALLAASRGGEPRAAELARELLPAHYPFVDDFRRALALDPANIELRRELGYLLLRMNFPREAEQEFRIVTEAAPDDLLAATQLGFLLHGRGDAAGAAPLFDRVLAGNDEDLANRVRAVLHLPQVVKSRAAAPPESIDAKIMAERSIKAGYMKDALKYLQVAHEADPGDFSVMLKLGWTYNILHQDLSAARWFDLARKSPDPQIATEAFKAWSSLRSASERFRTTAWIFPLFSTRWHDLFSYGQVKTELRTSLPIQPYLSVRFVGDTRQTVPGQAVGTAAPQYLSESAFILGAGIATVPWHGIRAWGEAGNSMGYLTHHMLPDYRGGVSIARALRSESTNWFADTAIDALFVSRFDNDFLVYAQNRIGYALGPPALRAQVYWNGNVTIDTKREEWANFIETGPGIRFSSNRMPKSMYLTFNALRGAYLIGARPNFIDLRTGLWYAFTH